MKNEYVPWDKVDMSEADYFKLRYLQLQEENMKLERMIDDCRKTNRDAVDTARTFQNLLKECEPEFDRLRNIIAYAKQQFELIHPKGYQHLVVWQKLEKEMKK